MIALEEREDAMTHEQFERENRYRIAMALAQSMLKQGVIDEEDFRKIDAIMLAKFSPILAGLYA